MGHDSALKAAATQMRSSVTHGIGKTSSPWWCTQLNASWPAVHPFLSAMALSFSTSLMFCRGQAGCQLRGNRLCCRAGLLLG